jgi:D,D-heptose 1,7-bisphosphate phosphatase
LKRTAVFLDRDGTINYDPGYLGDPEKFEFLPGVTEALKRLQHSGFFIFVVSNQSGIARGFFGEEDLKKIHDNMVLALLSRGVKLNGIYYCPHHPDDRCSCRKPSPKMVLDAAESYRIDLESSYFIGDRATDIETGRNAGCRTILVLTGEGKETLSQLAPGQQPDFVASDLGAATQWILEVEGKHQN